MTSYQKIVNDLNIIAFVINGLTIIGSALTIIIFSRKAFEKTSIGFYCKWLAIFDDVYAILNLSLSFASSSPSAISPQTANFTCKLFYYMTGVATSMPLWILAVFSLDQLITVSRKNRFQFFKKRWFQWLLVLGLFIIQCAILSPYFIFYGFFSVTIQNVTIYSCSTDPEVLQILMVVTFIESIFLPFFIIIISMLFVIRILIQSRKKVTSSGQSNNIVAKRRREIKFAFNSVVLNIIFIVFSTPVLIYFFFPVVDYFFFQLLNTIFFLLFNINFSLHFWVNLAINSVFRNEFLILFRIKK